MIITDIDNLLDKIESILVEVGQSDPQFKLGDWITYKPHEVRKILEQHKDELEEDIRRNGAMAKVNEFDGYIVLAQEFGVIPHSFHFEDYNEALEYLKYMLGLRSPHNKAIGCILNSKLEVLYKTEVGPDD